MREPCRLYAALLPIEALDGWWTSPYVIECMYPKNRHERISYDCAFASLDVWVMVGCR